MTKTAAKNKNTKAPKKGEKTEGTVIEAPEGTLASYLEQWNKFGEKKKGKAREKELDTVLEVAQEDLSAKDFAELEQTIAPERIEKREKNGNRAKKGEGLSRADWRAGKFQEAEEKGIWYPGYEEGCIICGETDRKHYSGGKCTRCYTIERNKRLGIDKEREEKRKEREAKKAEKLALIEEKKAEREKKKLEEKRAREEAAAKKKKEEADKGNQTKKDEEKKKAEIAAESKKLKEKTSKPKTQSKKADTKKATAKA